MIDKLELNCFPAGWTSCQAAGDEFGGLCGAATPRMLLSGGLPLYVANMRQASVMKGKVARGVFGDWRIAPFTSLRLARMK